MTRFDNKTQAWNDITHKTGISRVQFRNYESGLQEPKISWMFRLCDAYDIDLLWLMTGKPLAQTAKELAALTRDRKPSTEAGAEQ